MTNKFEGVTAEAIEVTSKNIGEFADEIDIMILRRLQAGKLGPATELQVTTIIAAFGCILDKLEDISPGAKDRFRLMLNARETATKEDLEEFRKYVEEQGATLYRSVRSNDDNEETSDELNAIVENYYKEINKKMN